MAVLVQSLLENAATRFSETYSAFETAYAVCRKAHGYWLVAMHGPRAAPLLGSPGPRPPGRLAAGLGPLAPGSIDK